MSPECNGVAHQIWQWCEDRNLWLIATHLPGVENVEADHESRNFTENTEWKLNPEIFNEICYRWGIPEIDLFASRLNNQAHTYCSWIPDLHAMFVNVFTLNWSQFDT